MSDARDAPDPDPDDDHASPDPDLDSEADAESASEPDSPTETRDGAGGNADAEPISTGEDSISESDADSARETDADSTAEHEPEKDPASPTTTDRPAETDADPSDEALPDPDAHPDDKEWCQETVDQATRQSILENDNHRCQFCGVKGPGKGGAATLQIHHIERDPDYCDLHDEANLSTLCEGCHSWMHKRPTAEDAPVELTDGDEEVLLPHDYEILRVLAMRGPATVGEIADYLYPAHSTMAVRERMWTLMGLDNIVETRDSQMVDQDAHTNEWCLLRPGRGSPIECSARGHIPADPDTRRTRIEDELVRQALRQGCDRQAVADAFGITYRTTWHKQRRAQAYDIPLGAVTGKSGRSAVGGDEASQEAN